MGLITQMQRRSVEKVYVPFEMTIRAADKFFLFQKEIRLLGISVGIGSCSDIHGVNIAVFSKEFPFNPDIHRLPDFPIRCGGAVILRSPRYEEIENIGNDHKTTIIPLCAVEGLELVAAKSHEKIFYVNGKSDTYVILI